MHAQRIIFFWYVCTCLNVFGVCANNNHNSSSKDLSMSWSIAAHVYKYIIVVPLQTKLFGFRFEFKIQQTKIDKQQFNKRHSNDLLFFLLSFFIRFSFIKNERFVVFTLQHTHTEWVCSTFGSVWLAWIIISTFLFAFFLFFISKICCCCCHCHCRCYWHFLNPI